MSLKNLEIPVADLRYLVVLVGGGDMVAVLTNKETWDSWGDQEDEMQFTDNIPAPLKLEFTDSKKLINFCVENAITIRDSVTGSLY
jgi:hypothetical protein